MTDSERDNLHQPRLRERILGHFSLGPDFSITTLSGSIFNRTFLSSPLRLAAVVLWMALMLALIGVTLHHIQGMGEQKFDVTVINLAGRQRMLVLRVMLLGQNLTQPLDPASRQTQRELLVEVAHQLENSHTELLRNASPEGEAPIGNLEKIFHQSPHSLDARLRRFVRQANEIAMVSSESSSHDHPTLRAMQSELDSGLITALEAMVKTFEQNAEQEWLREQELERALLFLTIACFALFLLLNLLQFQRRHRAEKELQENEQHFRNLTEGTGQGILVMQHGKALYANQTYADLLGFENPEQVMALDETWDLIAEEDRERLREYQDARMRGKEAPEHYEFRGRRQDGTLVWLETHVRVIRWQGRPAVQLTLLDITERKNSREKLEISEKRFRDLFEGSIQGILVHRKGKPLFANQAFLKIFGFATPREALEFQNLFALIAPRFRDQLSQSHDARLRGEEFPNPFQFEGIRNTGGAIWLEASARSVDWEGEPAVQLTLVDITKRKQAETQLHLLAAAMEHAGDAIFITDRKGIIQYVNPGFERVTGFSRKEAIGQNPRILKSGQQEPHFYQELWETLLAGKIWTGRYRNRRRNGTVYEVESTHSPVLGEDGTITDFISVQRDVTRQKGLEDQLQRSQRMEAIGNLAGGIAHDFNNLLMPIIGFTELALHRHKVGSEDHYDLTEVQKAAYRGKDLVSQILLFSRKTESLRQPIKLQPIGEEVLNLLRATLPRSIVLQYVIDQELPAIFGDSTQINQVLLNLCLNASQAMAQGGVLKVTVENVELDNFPVYLGEVISGPFVRIRVQDNGEGMGEETLSHIFEPFFTTKEVGKGTGLGLSTVFGIVSQHEGHLNVASKVGEGSTFEIFLRPCPEEFAGITPEPKPVRGGAESILLVDDEAPICEIGKRSLERMGYHVTTFTDSRAALNRFLEAPAQFDLVITDQSMPGLNGFELAQHLLQAKPGLPIVLCTGYSEDITQETAENNGIARFAFKPVKTDDLAAMVREALDLAKANQPENPGSSRQVRS